MIKIIVAEDSIVLRRLIVRSINSQEDMKVVGDAGSGKEIVSIASSTDFDIAVLDIEMECMDAGIKAAREIHKIKPLAKVIFLTLHDNDEMIFSALEDGAVDYIIKSEKTDSLIEHIRAVSSGKNPMNLDVQGRLQKEFRRLRQSEGELMFFIRNIAILTPAEKALLKLLVEGKTIKDIARLRQYEVTSHIKIANS